MENNNEPLLILGCTEFHSGGKPTGPLVPMDLIGHGPDAGRFSLEDGEDGEPRLMITVDKEYLEDFWKVWCAPLPEKDIPLTVEDFNNHLAIKKLT